MIVFVSGRREEATAEGGKVKNESRGSEAKGVLAPRIRKSKTPGARRAEKEDC